MSATRFRRRLARASLLTAVLGAAPAFAADKPATPEGALELRAFFSRMLPAAFAGPRPLIAVTPEGSDYLVTMDLSAVNDLIKGTGTSYDPATILYKLVEQDDGRWRTAVEQLPKIGFRARDSTGSLEFDGFRQSAVIDPAIAWFLDGSTNAAKGTIKLATPKLDQTINFGNLSADLATTAKGDGSVSTTAKEEIADLAIAANGVGERNQPVNWSARIDKAQVDIGIDGLMSRKVFDAWSLVADHPDRADLAQHETEFKGLLKAIAAPGLKFAEGIEAKHAVVASAIGAVALGDVKYEVGAANLGPQSSVKIGVAVDGLSLPAGLAPANAADLIPSKLDLAVELRGFDLTAAANEAIADMHVGGKGPLISDPDGAKVAAALFGAGPLRIVIAPSHVVSKTLALDFNGVVQYLANKASGSLTISRARVRYGDGDGQGSGAGRPGKGAPGAGDGEGPRQDGKRRRADLGPPSGRRPVDQGQRHPARQGAGLIRSGRRLAFEGLAAKILACGGGKFSCLAQGMRREYFPTPPFRGVSAQPALSLSL